MSRIDNGHWKNEYHAQRVTLREWREILLNHEDQIIYKGRLRVLKAKHLGAGVYELTKAPIED
jgi:hypothetical protein